MRRRAFTRLTTRAASAVLAALVASVAVGPIGLAAAAPADARVRADAPVPTDAAGPGGRVNLLLKFRAGAGSEAAAAVARAGGRLDRAISALGVEVVSVPATAAGAALAALATSPAVEWAEPDAWVKAADTVPNDPLWSTQWGPARTRAPKAWDRTTGDPSVVVAVLDTGVDAAHPDLAGALVTGTDLVNRDADPADDQGHGTAVAGIVAARTNNLSGMSAYCWKCAVMPVKVLGADGMGSMSTIAEGITWAVDRGARVVNLSLGGPSGGSTLERAVSYARNKGAVVIAAAGNDGVTNLSYPAAYSGVVSVAGSDSNDARYSWSNYGSWVRIAAPGCNTATLRGGAYGSFCGTSSATPAAAGIAALAFAATPGATGVAVEQAMYTTAVPVGSFVAHGRVDAAATLAAVTPAAVPGAPTTVAATGADSSATITWSPPSNDGGSAITSYTVTPRDSAGERPAVTVAAPATKVTITGLVNGTSYTFTVRATNGAGTGPASAASNAVTPAGVPSAPTSVRAEPGHQSATVSWARPASDGGSAITAYGVVASPGGATVTVPGGTNSATVTGLTNGTSYTFSVNATNQLGSGPSASSSVVTPAADPVWRLAGDDRMMTAVALSRDSYPSGGAGAVVLSRSDSYADALAGTPLAVARNAPLLLTGQSGLDSRTRTEVQRVLGPGRTVHLLGGTFAIGLEVERELVGLGYVVVRYTGEDRFATAVAVADRGLGNPTTLLLATGTDFRDALVAGAAASTAGAAVLLTGGTSMHPATAAYVATRPTARRYAVGGPAVSADPTARPIAGADYVETSRKVAEAFFTAPTTVAVATVANFPDALGGGAHIGRKRAPLVLTDPHSLSPTIGAYLSANGASLGGAYIGGGTAAVSDNVRDAVEQAISS